MRWPLHLAFILTCALAVATAISGRAFAHAALIAASPADGAVVTNAPAVLTLSFSEPVSPLILKLIGPDSTSRTLDRFVLKDRTLMIEAPTDLSSGTHVLSWRVISEDGHPVGGAVVFSIGAASGRSPTPETRTDPAVRAILWLGKVGLYLGLLMGLGGAAFATWVGPLPRDARRPLGLFILLGSGALPLAFAAQGLDILDRSLGSLGEADVWSAAAASSFGRTALAAAVAFLLGLASLAVRGHMGPVFAGAALLTVGVALAASGHASAASPQWLMRSAVFIHAVSVTAWAGALVPLFFALREADAITVLRQFSRWIPVVVGLTLLSGGILAVVQLQQPGALISTGYGWVLLIKLAWVAILLGLAAINRYRLTPLVLSRTGIAARTMRRMIAAETLLVFLVLGTVATWRFTPPPRALLDAGAPPASIHIHTAKAMADIRVSPGRAGPASISISLLDGEFGPLTVKEVRCVMSNPSAGVEPIERQAVRSSDGTWHVDSLVIPIGGRWTIELEILVSDFEMIRLSETVEIKP